MLASKLQKALLQHQLPLRESEEKKDDATLAYISKILLSDGEEAFDQQNVIDQHYVKSYQDYLDELHTLIRSSSSSSSSSFTVPSPNGEAASGFGYYDHLQGTEQQVSKKEKLQGIIVKAAHAVADNDATEVYRLVEELSSCASPQGDCWERSAFYFIEALVARLGGYGADLFKVFSDSLRSRDFFTVRLLNLPVFRVMHEYSKQMILERCRGAKLVHIVDFGILHGLQWPSVMKAFSETGSPPALKITGIDFPNRVDVSKTGSNLAEYASMYGIHLEYHAVSTYAWELVQPRSCPEEVLIVNCNLRLRHLKADGTAAKNPRRRFFENIFNLRPRMLLLCLASANLSSPMFIPRFKEAVRYYTAKMEYFDALMVNEPEAKALIEKVISKNIINVVACEGHDRVEHPNRYDNWDQRIKKGGFLQLAVSEDVRERVRRVWGGYQHNENVGIGMDENWILLGWKDVVMYAMSAWEPIPYHLH